MVSKTSFGKYSPKDKFIIIRSVMNNDRLGIRYRLGMMRYLNDNLEDAD
jgi:hypothetical protein